MPILIALWYLPLAAHRGNPYAQPMDAFANIEYRDAATFLLYLTKFLK